MSKQVGSVTVDDCVDVTFVICSEFDPIIHSSEPVGTWDGPMCGGSYYLLDFDPCLAFNNNPPPGGPGDPGDPGDPGEPGGDPTQTSPLVIYCEDEIHGCANENWYQVAVALDVDEDAPIVNYLQQHENSETEEIKLFLESPTTTTLEAMFAKKAIDALMAGGEVDFLDQIIYKSSLSACAVNIIKALQLKDSHYSVVPSITSQPLSHISQAVLNLFDDSDEYSLIFSSSQLGNDANGNPRNATTTYFSSDEEKGWEIILDSDLLVDATQLSIAKTIIHEVVHAGIGHLLRENRGSNEVMSLQNLYSSYINDGYVGGVAFNMTEHQFMSEFVEAMAHSLGAWDNYTQNTSYYEMLSWGGLETSPIYNTLTNKTQIQNAILDERFDRNGAKSTKCY